MKLLALESGGPRCSVCVWLDGRSAERETDEPRAHASHILPLVDAALAQAGVTLRDLDGLVFGEGPGGLTGLRVAASVVQGFALVTEQSIVAVSNLEALALRVAHACAGGAPIVIAHDLGLGAVVWQAFSRSAQASLRVQALAPASLCPPEQMVLPVGEVVVAGSAAAAVPDTGGAITVRPERYASALDLARVVAMGGGKKVAVDAAQPLYWRHPVHG